MDIETFRELCLSIEGAEESLPFIQQNVLAFKFAGKMFSMVRLEPADGVFAVDLKCDPQRSIELREKYAGIGPGHCPTTLLWNRIILESDVPDSLIKELVWHSVDEVVKKLPAKQRKNIKREL